MDDSVDVNEKRDFQYLLVLLTLTGCNDSGTNRNIRSDQAKKPRHAYITMLK